MMTKIAHILFSILFVVSTSGFNISIHYCDEEIYSVSFYGEAEKCEHYHGHGMNYNGRVKMQAAHAEADGGVIAMNDDMLMLSMQAGSAMNTKDHSKVMKESPGGKKTGKKQMGEMNMENQESKDDHASKPHNHCDDKSVNIEKIDEDFIRTNNALTFSKNTVIKIIKLFVAEIHPLFVQVRDNKPQHIKFESPPSLDTKPVLALIQSFRL